MHLSFFGISSKLGTYNDFNKINHSQIAVELKNNTIYLI